MTDRTAPAGQLDAEELLHLAMQALEKARDEDAMTYLKRGLVLEPRSGLLHYLLGALYAQLGIDQRAIDELNQAVAYSPELHTASFQLGLLHFASTDFDAAEKAWQPLAALPAGHPLGLFRSGLLHFVRSEFAESLSDLRRGMELNDEYPSLNPDIAMLAAMAEEAQSAGKNDAQVPAAHSGLGRHVLLSGYEGPSPDKKSN